MKVMFSTVNVVALFFVQIGPTDEVRGRVMSSKIELFSNISMQLLHSQDGASTDKLCKLAPLPCSASFPTAAQQQPSSIPGAAGQGLLGPISPAVRFSTDPRNASKRSLKLRTLASSLSLRSCFHVVSNSVFVNLSAHKERRIPLQVLF